MVVDIARSGDLEVSSIQAQEQSLARVPEERVRLAHERLQKMRETARELTVSGAMQVAMRQREEHPSGY